jgi:cell wall assembly regulator SMI1
MSWRELITGMYEDRAQQPGIGVRPEFCPAASAADIDDAEVRLNARLPACLRSLLLETNGVMDMMSIDGGEWFLSMWLLWSVQEIVEQNEFFRRAIDEGTYERDFRQMAFFAGAGSDGILFGFPVSEDGTYASRVVVWHPIMDELDELATSLKDFLRGWLTGAIFV